MKRKALGRGLSALLSETGETTAVQSEPVQEKLQDIDVHLIVPNPHQPRTSFDDEMLAELAQSIRTHGVVQPLVVRRHSGSPGQFELIAGERRLRAAKLAGLAHVPSIVIDAEDIMAMELALVENLQRSDLNPIEEANAFESLIQEFGLTQEEVAQRIGRSRTAVANSLRLLHLSPTVQDLVASGKISAGHARTLLSIPSVEKQVSIAQQIAAQGLSVREAEKLAQERKTDPVAKAIPQKTHVLPDIHTADLERRLQQTLKTKVRLKRDASGKGTLEIDFFDDDHLTTLLRRLNVPMDVL